MYIKWADWTCLDPKRDMSIFVQDNEALNIPVGFPEDEDVYDPLNFFSDAKTVLPQGQGRNPNIGRNIIYGEVGDSILRRPSIGATVTPGTVVIPPDDEQPDQAEDSPDSSAGRTAAPHFQAKTEDNAADAEESRRLTREQAKRTGKTVTFD